MSDSEGFHDDLRKNANWLLGILVQLLVLEVVVDSCHLQILHVVCFLEHLVVARGVGLPLLPTVGLVLSAPVAFGYPLLIMNGHLGLASLGAVIVLV